MGDGGNTLSESRISELASTSAVTVLSSAHGRQRRAERNISKGDLRSAVQYGKKEPSPHPRTGEMQWKFTFRDIVYLTDYFCKREITCWPLPGTGIDIEEVPIDAKLADLHAKALARVRADPSSWTSHTVIVVDQSGSMRKIDVKDGATRSDVVWLTLALEFISRRLNSNEASSTDVISVVGMNNEGSLLLDRRPTDWVLFNDVIKLLRSATPMQDGNYAPALKLAERLLLSNESGSCALLLCFLSDGRPSDKLPPGPCSAREKRNAQAKTWISNVASRFGRRLNIATIGFANQGEDFSVLQAMALAAKQYECVAEFKTPSLDAESLGLVVSSLTSTLTATKTELTEMSTLAKRTVRDVFREARGSVDDAMLNNSWYSYSVGNARRLVWSTEAGDWVQEDEWLAGVTELAMKKTIFGEGAERMVRKFRMVSSRGVFVGPKMVAKESRFIEDLASHDHKQFHKIFCKTQIKAKSLAEDFNAKLSTLPFVNNSTPRVTFLDCSVYVVQDINLGTVGVLVEKMLDPLKYKKWNNNCGKTATRLGQQNTPALAHAEPLDTLREGSDEEDEGSEESGDEGVGCTAQFTIDDIAQAFTHFTYRKTKRKMMVCDLQGVLNDTSSPPCFEFTDPVIHYRSISGRVNVYGRTDRGRKGIDSFFATHVCSDLCRALNRRWVTVPPGWKALNDEMGKTFYVIPCLFRP